MERQKMRKQPDRHQTKSDELFTIIDETIDIPNPCSMTEHKYDMVADKPCATQNFRFEGSETLILGTLTHRFEKKLDLVPSNFRHRIRHSMCDLQGNRTELDADKHGHNKGVIETGKKKEILFCSNVKQICVAPRLSNIGPFHGNTDLLNRDSVRKVRSDNTCCTTQERSSDKEKTCSSVCNDLILVSRNDSQRYRNHQGSDHSINTGPEMKDDSLAVTCNSEESKGNRKDTVMCIQPESSTADEPSADRDDTCDLILVRRDNTQIYRQQHGSEYYKNTTPATKIDRCLMTCNRVELQNNKNSHDNKYTMTSSFCVPDKKYRLEQPTALSQEKCHVPSFAGISDRTHLAGFKANQRNKVEIHLQKSERVVQSNCASETDIKLACNRKVSKERTKRKRHNSSQKNTDIPTKKGKYTSVSRTVTNKTLCCNKYTDLNADLQRSKAAYKARSKNIRKLSSKVTKKTGDKGNRSLPCVKSHSRSKTSCANHSVDVRMDQDTSSESERLKLNAVDEIHKQIAFTDDKQVDYGNESVNVGHLHELIPLDSTSNIKYGRRKVRAPSVSKQQSVLQRRYSTSAIWETVVSKYD